MTLTLTPEQERRITAYAKQKQKPIERVIEELIADLPQESIAEPIAEEPMTWGARKLAELRAAGAIGAFQNRPEDSPELAQKFQALAEGRIEE
jgi:hypothetical protein